MKQFVAAKLHGIYVTEANLNYHGSVTLDPEHCEEVGILPMEYVDTGTNTLVPGSQLT